MHGYYASATADRTAILEFSICMQVQDRTLMLQLPLSSSMSIGLRDSTTARELLRKDLHRKVMYSRMKDGIQFCPTCHSTVQRLKPPVMIPHSKHPPVMTHTLLKLCPAAIHMYKRMTSMMALPTSQ